MHEVLVWTHTDTSFLISHNAAAGGVSALSCGGVVRNFFVQKIRTTGDCDAGRGKEADGVSGLVNF